MEAMNASERTTTTNGSLRRAQPNPTRVRVSGRVPGSLGRQRKMSNVHLEASLAVGRVESQHGLARPARSGRACARRLAGLGPPPVNETQEECQLSGRERQVERVKPEGRTGRRLLGNCCWRGQTRPRREEARTTAEQDERQLVSQLSSYRREHPKVHDLLLTMILMLLLRKGGEGRVYAVQERTRPICTALRCLNRRTQIITAM